MAWTDMSIFSVHSRHGDPSLPYPDKTIPRALVACVLVLGLLPNLLTLLGLWHSWRAPGRWPLTVYGGLSLATYAWWVIAQDSWALKTKYLLFLLPVYALLATEGVERALQLRGRAGALLSAAVLGGLGLLFGCASSYIAVFAFA
jgi:hypothetical protein